MADPSEPIPLRPINSCIGSPTYQVSRYLADLLKPLCSDSNYTVKNSRDFTEFIRTQTVQPDEEIVSLDVVSLFTSIPVDLALEVIDHRLESNPSWQENTNLTKDQVVELTRYVLKNSYLSYEGTMYHQTFGCAMGSPVSAVIAELVMGYVEAKALSTFPGVSPRWWKRYVDDSNYCIKSNDLENFHRHLNSINQHIQFTIERVDLEDGKPTISFLDTSSAILPNGNIEVQVFRKATHTNKYLAYESHQSAQHKRSVINTLMHRANTIPSNHTLKMDEMKRVQESLQINGYPVKFIEIAAAPRSNPRSGVPEHTGFAVVPYVKGVSDQVRRALQQSGVKTVFKSVRTLASIFKKPKDRPSEDRITGIVYKVDCKNCEFTYVVESKRCWALRSIEHDPARAASRESLIRHHAHTTGHDIHPRYARILEHNEHNHHLFLESSHSSLAKNSANERAEFPRAYVPLLKSLGDSK